MGMVLSSCMASGLCEQRHFGQPWVACQSPDRLLYAPAYEVGTIKRPPRSKHPWRKGQLLSVQDTSENNVSREESSPPCLRRFLKPISLRKDQRVQMR